jgi:hypothetical protein
VAGRRALLLGMLPVLSCRHARNPHACRDPDLRTTLQLADVLEDRETARSRSLRT